MVTNALKRLIFLSVGVIRLGSGDVEKKWRIPRPHNYYFLPSLSRYPLTINLISKRIRGNPAAAVIRSTTRVSSCEDNTGSPPGLLVYLPLIR